MWVIITCAGAHLGYFDVKGIKWLGEKFKKIHWLFGSFACIYQLVGLVTTCNLSDTNVRTMIRRKSARCPLAYTHSIHFGKLTVLKVSILSTYDSMSLNSILVPHIIFENNWTVELIFPRNSLEKFSAPFRHG